MRGLLPQWCISRAYYYVASVTQSPTLVDADCDASDASSDAFASLCVALRQNIFAPGRVCQLQVTVGGVDPKVRRTGVKKDSEVYRVVEIMLCIWIMVLLTLASECDVDCVLDKS